MVRILPFAYISARVRVPHRPSVECAELRQIAQALAKSGVASVCSFGRAVPHYSPRAPAAALLRRLAGALFEVLVGHLQVVLGRDALLPIHSHTTCIECAAGSSTITTSSGS